MNMDNLKSFSFQSSQLLGLLLLMFCLPSCKKDCSDSATCHTYQDNTCEDKRAENAPVVTDLQDRIYSITGSQPDLPKEELAGLDATFEQAYFVGLGEATHGTLEFFEMKHRIFQYLVEKHGYKAIGFEATWGGALHVNRYVIDGIGSAKESVRKMQFWTWRTEEVVALVEWMRSYNLGKTDEEKIKFYGFDVQSGIEEVQLISDYLKRVAPDLEKEVTLKLSNLVDTIGRDWNGYRALSVLIKNNFRDAIKNGESIFEANAETMIAASSQEEYELVKHAFTILRQFEDVVNSDLGSGKRDFYMAKNSEWIREYIGGEVKIALWAHNAHVTRGYATAQGAQLAKIHGDAYQNIGFSFSTGSFQAVQSGRGVTTDNEVLSPNCLTTNALLSDVGVDNFYIVFDELPNESAAASYFSVANRMFSLGALFDPNNVNRFIYPQTLATDYDVLIHFDDTNAAVPY